MRRLQNLENLEIISGEYWTNFVYDPLNELYHMNKKNFEKNQIHKSYFGVPYEFCSFFKIIMNKIGQFFIQRNLESSL